MPTNARKTEKHIVKSFILVVLTPLESSGRVYFLTISGVKPNCFIIIGYSSPFKN